MKPMKPYCHPSLREASILFCLMNCVVAAAIAFAIAHIRPYFQMSFEGEGVSLANVLGHYLSFVLTIPTWTWYAMSIMVIGLLMWKERRMHSAKALLLNGAVLFVMALWFTGTWVFCVLRTWLQIMAGSM